MRYPEFIGKGQTIGFAAPSFGVTTEPYHTAFLNAEKIFREKGFLLKEGPCVFKADGIGISSTPENCGRELTDMYCDPESRLLMSVGGGELMCEILPYVDFEKIRKADPKWYIGLSDNTNFTFTLPLLCDTAAVYGPCAPSFGMEPWHRSIQMSMDLLTGKNLTVHGFGRWEKESLKSPENPLASYNCRKRTVIRTENWDGQPFSGRFIGGCLDVLIMLLGTRFDRVREFNERYREDGIIWFMEACDLSVLGIRRALFQMKEAGWFQHVKGVLVGRPLCMGQEIMGLDQYEAVLYTLRDLGVPVIMDLDFGHIPPAMPIISGGYGTVSPYGKNIQIAFDLTR